MKTILKILLLVLFPTVLSAQGGGSIYSRYGAGDVVNYFSARQLGLGAIGVTSAQSDYLNFINPASLSNTKFVRFEAGLNANGTSISNSSTSSFYASSDFSGFGMAFPIERDLGISMAIGMVPYTSVQYEIEESFDDQGYDLRYFGSGGISKAFISASYKLPFDLSIGLSFNYFTGNIEYNSFVDYGYSNDNKSSLFKKVHNYRGTGFTFGLESGDLSNLVKSESISDLKFGFVVSYNKNLPTDTTSIIKLTNTEGVEKTALVETQIPTRIDAGLSFVLNKNKRIMADFSYQPWDKYELSDQSYSNLKTATRFGLGIEFVGDQSPFASSADQMDFRLGFTYEDTHLKVKGESISQISLHGGFSYPVGMLSTLDVGLQIGQRGTKDFGLMKEMFYKANFSLSLGELWFMRMER